MFSYALAVVLNVNIVKSVGEEMKSLGPLCKANLHKLVEKEILSEKKTKATNVDLDSSVARIVGIKFSHVALHGLKYRIVCCSSYVQILGRLERNYDYITFRF